MNHRIIANATFSCSKCGQKYILKSPHISFKIINKHARNMGEEIHHSAQKHGICQICNKQYEINFEVYEYPVGTINRTDNLSNGVTQLKAEYHISTQVEEPDNSRVIGAATGGAIFGASVGGPIGALIGGLVGGIIGDSVSKENK